MYVIKLSFLLFVVISEDIRKVCKILVMISWCVTTLALGEKGIIWRHTFLYVFHFMFQFMPLSPVPTLPSCLRLLFFPSADGLAMCSKICLSHSFLRHLIFMSLLILSVFCLFWFLRLYLCKCLHFCRSFLFVLR